MSVLLLNFTYEPLGVVDVARAVRLLFARKVEVVHRGERELRRAGAAGEPCGGTRPWEFGDSEPWDVPRTVRNSVLRRAAARGGGPLPSVGRSCTP